MANNRRYSYARPAAGLALVRRDVRCNKGSLHMRFVLLVAAALIYFIGCSHFNGEVRDPCTHGNCKHGWYSQYNKSEKTAARMWTIGYPIAGFIIYFLFSFRSRKELENGNKTSSDTKDIPIAESDLPSELQPPISITSGDYSKPTKVVEPSVKATDSQHNPPTASIAIMCSKCGGQMTLRIARQGRYSGRQFWGCNNYPRCRGIVDYRT